MIASTRVGSESRLMGLGYLGETGIHEADAHKFEFIEMPLCQI